MGSKILFVLGLLCLIAAASFADEAKEGSVMSKYKKPDPTELKRTGSANTCR